MDATDFAGGQKNRIRFGFHHPSIDLFRAPQIEITTLCRQNLAALDLEASNNGRSDHASVPCYVYPLTG
jgi:hypothetical protein